MFRMFILLVLVSCGKVENGRDGINGMSGVSGRDGRDYYSYMVNVNLQEIIGDGRTEVFEISESNHYQLPKDIDVTVDNSYPECKLLELQLVVETDSEDLLFTFGPTDNRYKMRLISGPVNKVLDTSTLRVYYKGRPEVDCGDVVYRLHSGVNFQLRVIKELEIE